MGCTKWVPYSNKLRKAGRPAPCNRRTQKKESVWRQMYDVLRKPYQSTQGRASLPVAHAFPYLPTTHPCQPASSSARVIKESGPVPESLFFPSLLRRSRTGMVNESHASGLRLSMAYGLWRISVYLRCSNSSLGWLSVLTACTTK